MSFVSVGKVRFMSYVMLLQELACITISEPMRWQERGDVGGGISAQVAEHSYGRQQQRTHVAAREDDEHDAG